MLINLGDGKCDVTSKDHVAVIVKD
jgi:hypothetical protein